MALTDNMVGKQAQWLAGSFENYTKLPTKNASALYVVDDNNKLYLYAGTNPIYSRVDVIDSVSGDSTLPVTSKAVYNYVASAFEVVDGTTKGITDADMTPGHFYYYEDGTLKFKYNFSAPLTLTAKGIKSVTALPAAGQGETEQIYCLITKNANGAITDSSLYFYPTTSSSAVKIATGDGFVQTSPASAQTIEKDLILSSGNLTLSAGKVLTVDTIQKASTGVSDKITLNGNSAVQGTLTVSSDISASNITATNITANTLLKSNNLTIEGIINNEGIFSTVKAVEGTSAAQLKLNSSTELLFGSNYYLKPGSISLPGGSIASALTIAGDVTANKGNFNSLEVSGASTLKSTLSVTGATTLSNTITTNYFTCTLNSNSVADKMTMSKPLYFGSAYYIDTTGAGNLNTLTIGSGNVTNDLTITGNLALTKITNAYTFGNQTFEMITEGSGDSQSGSTVTGVAARLVYGGQQILTKADITASNGLIKTVTDGINANLNGLSSTVTNNKTAADQMIIAANAKADGSAPDTVTANTKVWIDTSLGNGVIKIKNASGVWTPVSSVWT